MVVGKTSFKGLVLCFLVGSACHADNWQKISSLYPTQFALGYREVAEKKETLQACKGRAAMQAHLEANPVPVVRGPGNRDYILDHHHLVRALYDQGERQAVVHEVDDWSDLSERDFWAKMGKSHYLYLFDEKGKGPLDVSKLPKYIQDLKDDPYRSLSYFVRKQGGYHKTTEYFAEFRWAEYFRKRVTVGKTDKDFERAIDEAMKLSRTHGASGLPGALKPGEAPVPEHHHHHASVVDSSETP